MSKTTIPTGGITADAINGTLIADDAINSEHYTDGSIDTAHIGDNQVTAAKATGVGGLVYVGGASIINTATSQVNVDNVFTSTYRSYRVIIEATVGSNTADTRMKLRDSSGDISVSSKYFAVLAGINQSGGVQASTQTQDDHFRLFENTFNDTNSDYPVGCCELTIYAPLISTDLTHITMTGSYLHSGGEERARYGCLILQAQKAVTGLALYPSTGNMNDVQVKVYGMVNS